MRAGSRKRAPVRGGAADAKVTEARERALMRLPIEFVRWLPPPPRPRPLRHLSPATRNHHSMHCACTSKTGRPPAQSASHSLSLLHPPISPPNAPPPPPPAAPSPPSAKRVKQAVASPKATRASPRGKGTAVAAPPPPPAPTPLPPLAASAAATTIRARLLWPTGEAATTLTLRPSAAAVAESLGRVVGDAVTLPHGATSALLVGPRGAGKTLVVERVLRSVKARVGCTCTLTVGAALPEGAPPPRVGVVRLSGLLHWEERVAFREAARQLCAQFGLPFERSASHDENIGFFADVLAQLASAKRAAVFVLDELDAFARRSRQALLYNLCDRVSSARVAAALVGVSARIDCVDLLEKRVRSRFSGRVLYPAPPRGSRRRGCRKRWHQRRRPRLRARGVAAPPRHRGGRAARVAVSAAGRRPPLPHPGRRGRLECGRERLPGHPHRHVRPG